MRSCKSGVGALVNKTSLVFIPLHLRKFPWIQLHSTAHYNLAFDFLGSAFAPTVLGCHINGCIEGVMDVFGHEINHYLR